MKILISTILLISTLLLTCDKLSASGEGSSRSGRKRPRTLNQVNYVPPNKNPDIPPTRTIPYLNRLIGIWRHPQTDRIFEVQLVGNNIWPDPIYYRRHNTYVTRSIEDNVDSLTIIVYEDANFNVLGAKLLPNTAGKFEPTNTQIFITFMGLDFRVTIDPHTKHPKSVKLAEGDFKPAPAYREANGVKSLPFTIGGVSFFVDIETRNNYRVLGAYLDTNVHGQQD